MRPSVRTTSLLCCLALVGGLVVGCSDSDDETTTTTAEAPATTAQSFTVPTGEGTVRLTLDGALPADWPEDFPVPDGATPAGSGEMASEDATRMIGVFTAAGNAQETYEFYRDNPDLSVTGSTVFGSAGPDDAATLTLNGQFTGRVSVIPRSGTTYIVVNLQIGSPEAPTGTGG